MKRFLIVALVGLAAAFPLAFAQDADPFIGGGFGVTFVGGSTITALTIQGGADDLIGSAALRGNFDIGISDGSFGFGVDFLADFPSDDVIPYFGGGFGLLQLGGSFFQLHATGGLEFFVSDLVGLFAEIQPTYFLTAQQFGATLRFGANYHFD